MMKQQNKFYTALLIILGFVALCAYIWLRFIRERFPRDIPFSLSLLSFLMLSYICIIFVFLIYSILREIKIQNSSITFLVNYVYMPLKVLDEAIKTNKYIQSFYEQLLTFLIHRFKEHDYIKVNTIYLKAYLIFHSIPRGIMALALIIDVFGLSKLYLIYKVVYVYIFLLLGKYIEYSFKYAKDQYILKIKELASGISTDYLDPEDTQDTLFFGKKMDIEAFLIVHINNLVHNGMGYSYDPLTSISFRNEYARRELNLLELPANEYKRMTDKFYVIMNHLISLSLHIDQYELEKTLSWHAKYKALVYFIYFICWCYILLVSYPSIPNPFGDILLILLYTLPFLEDPFSGVLIIFF